MGPVAHPGDLETFAEGCTNMLGDFLALADAPCYRRVTKVSTTHAEVPTNHG